MTFLPHSVPKGPKSGRASLKTRKGRASLKTRKGRASSKTGEGLVIIKTSKALPFGVTNLKVCSQKIVPIFSFFLFGPAGKLQFFQGNFALVADSQASLWAENCPNFLGFYFSSGFQFRDFFFNLGNCRENLRNFLSENIISRPEERNVA
jgi:hypothetical protein